MDIIKNPKRTDWAGVLRRPALDKRSLQKTVREVLKEVRKNGDKAVRKYSRKFDGVKLKHFEISEREFARAEEKVPVSLKTAIALASGNIKKFHKAQAITEPVIETMPGVKCWRRSAGIEKAGLYVPGGRAPLFSTVLMLGIPARLAGCREIVLCTPPDKNGDVHPAILHAARLAGITKLFRVGGIQAIGAMAFGTETIPAVSKIFGPGNQYVTMAKQMVQLHGVAIDMPAGPTELAVYADETADPMFVAADLLSQAEHGDDSQVLLVMSDYSLVNAVKQALEKLLNQLDTRDIAWKTLQNSSIIIIEKREDAVDLINEYAPEHLILNCADAAKMAERIVNAGSVFIGPFSPESAGDYATGTNHTLPTNGFAKAYSGVSLDSFVKKITYQQLTIHGLKSIAEAVETMARAEGLPAHANAVSLRLKNISSDS